MQRSALDGAVNLPLAETGGINADVAVAPGAAPLTERALSGSVNLDIERLAVIEKLSIGQHWRFGYVSWRGAPPVAKHQIFDNFANCHIVPATGNSRSIMLGVRPNELLRLGGYLIRIEREDGWRWQSSLSRRDNGPGACEVIYVIDAAVIPV